MLTNGMTAEPKATTSVVRTSFTGEPGAALGAGSRAEVHPEALLGLDEVRQRGAGERHPEPHQARQRDALVRPAATRAIAEADPHPAGDQQQDREQAGVDGLAGVGPVQQPQPAVDDVEVVGAGDRPGQEADRQEAVDHHELGEVDEDRRREVRLQPGQADVEGRRAEPVAQDVEHGAGAGLAVERSGRPGRRGSPRPSARAAPRPAGSCCPGSRRTPPGVTEAAVRTKVTIVAGVPSAPAPDPRGPALVSPCLQAIREPRVDQRQVSP